MATIDHDAPPNFWEKLRQRRDELVASPSFQSWAARFPLTKRVARRDGERLFDLVAGFAYSQVLQAVVSLALPDRLSRGPKSVAALAHETGLSSETMKRLCDAASALELLSRDGTGRYRLARLGAALRGVPGLQEMILHHHILYRDLSDPEAFLRGQTTPELAKFWPYVFGPGAERDPVQSERYSRLMSETQSLVAEETLKAVSLRDVSVLMDIGGGSGAFLQAALAQAPKLQGLLVDLPGVVPESHPRMVHSAVDFRTDPLPKQADAISLIRVLYDHADDTVRALLLKVFNALPSGGRLIISEPMSGGDQPTRAGDVYFAFYCMAMGTGCVRSPERIKTLLEEVGFSQVNVCRMDRRFVTQTILAAKP